MPLVDSWVKKWFPQQKSGRKLSTRRLKLEALEDRCLLTYAITDLGTLPNYPTSLGAALNASGQVTGTVNAGQGTYRAFLYSDGKISDMGLPDQLPSWGNGINDSGQVAGFIYGRAFLYSDGTIADLGTLGGTRAAAVGINNTGNVVGWAMTADEYIHAFFYSDGRMLALEDLPGGNGGFANGINDSDQVTGYAFGAGFVHATIWDQGKITDLGTLPGDDFSTGNAINASGQVVGDSTLLNAGTGEQHAFLYSKGTMTDLGTLGGRLSHASGINTSGQVVGYSSLPPPMTYADHAFLYNDGTMTDLNSLIDPNSGWVLYQATAINDAGQIVGDGLNPQGDVHAFLLSPESEPLKQDEALVLHDPGVVRVQVSWFAPSKSEYSTVASTPGESLVANPHTGEIHGERPLPGSAKFWLEASGLRALAARSTNAGSASNWFDPLGANSPLS
jgi:probable HAF family extracellular repeat protein